ncbi:hypothetical protein EDC04DRAFT_2659233 [Pisolithus marmoratus]|nr:hypothetical protein EDC04DRAFT_2659233 [Pisolithus marmoratus]
MCIQNFFLFPLSLAFPLIPLSISRLSVHLHLGTYIFFNFSIPNTKCKQDFGLAGGRRAVVCVVCNLHTYGQCSTISAFRL